MSLPTPFVIGPCMSALATNHKDNNEMPSVKILSASGIVIITSPEAIKNLLAACEHALKPWDAAK